MRVTSEIMKHLYLAESGTLKAATQFFSLYAINSLVKDRAPLTCVRAHLHSVGGSKHIATQREGG